MQSPDVHPVIAAHGDPIAPVILGVTGIFLFAVIGRFIARRFGQPTVVAELCMGILPGNVAWYLGVDTAARQDRNGSGGKPTRTRSRRVRYLRARLADETSPSRLAGSLLMARSVV